MTASHAGAVCPALVCCIEAARYATLNLNRPSFQLYLIIFYKSNYCVIARNYLAVVGVGCFVLQLERMLTLLFLAARLDLARLCIRQYPVYII